MAIHNLRLEPVGGLLWIGDDLIAYSSDLKPDCAVIAAPYYVNQQPVGAVGVLGPMRMQYEKVISTVLQIGRTFEILQS